jgi:uncharacterized membrane protein YoaK (UPF0700 family)
LSRSRRHLALVLLAVNSGATDAIGIVSLGGAFTSVMTGNMVLLGLSASRGDGALSLRSGLAIVLYITGAFVGARIAGAPRADDPAWPRAVRNALCVQLAGEALFAAGWWAAGGHPSGVLQPVLLGISAVNLGIQSSAIMRRLGAVDDLPHGNADHARGGAGAWRASSQRAPQRQAALWADWGAQLWGACWQSTPPSSSPRCS